MTAPAGPPDPGDRPVRVLIVDDQQLVRSGFALILSTEDGLEVVGQAANGAEALDLARSTTPDVVLMDVQMPVMDGIEATRALVAEDLGRIVILTTFDRDDYLFDALRAGASGFLLKNAGPEALVDAVRAAAHGHALLAPEVTRRVIARMVAEPDANGSGDAPHGRSATTDTPGSGGASTPARREVGTPPELDLLTDREREVLGLIGRGLSNAEIAAELFVGEAPVKTHVSNCLAKLHLRDRVQAVVWAHRAGLIPAEE